MKLPISSGREVAAEAWNALGARWRLLGLGLLLIAGAAAGIVSPLALGSIVDAVSAGDVARVWWLGALMVGAIVLAAVLSTLGVVVTARLFERMLATLRERMVARAFELPQSRIEEAGTADVISRAGDDVSVVSEAIPNVVPALSGALFTIVVTVIGMAAIDPWYGLAILLIVPVHALAVRWYLRTAPSLYAEERAAMADRARRLLDALNGLASVRAFGLGGSHAARIAASSWAVVRWSMRARAVQNAFFARLNFAEFLGMSALLLVGALLVGNGAGTIGGTTAAMLLFLRLFGPINQLLFVVDELQSALASLARIVGVIRADVPAVAAHPPAPGLSLTGLSHAYVEGHPVLRDVDLEIAAGESVAVVGASGAGKSTLAGIAAGIHEPVSGAVRRAGSTALVTQEVHLFEGTLRENLALAAADATDAELTDALRRVGAELALDAPAHGLTDAQAQLIALARVLLADPSLVVLDEATAEGGSADAAVLAAAAATAIAGRTALVVAHRLDQAAACDRVLVMEHGRIVEQGPHAELLAAGGRYAALWSAQRRLPPR